MAHSIVRNKEKGHSHKPDRRRASQRYRSTVRQALRTVWDEEAMDNLFAKAECIAKREGWNIYEV